MDGFSQRPQPSPQANGQRSLLAGLNPAQREAALALVGPVAILAGPGTGKTHTITTRIAYGVQQGVFDPQRLLALTFTNRAAGALRTRLNALGITGVQARTFHSAAMRQLGYFWPQAIGGSLPPVISDKSPLVRAAAEQLGLRLSDSDVRDTIARIERLKVTEQPLREALDLAYEHEKDARGRLDFEDILLATAGMLESEPGITAQVRSQYRFFVVDEYQDVSPLQHRLLRLWLGTRRELCVVGDPAQTIYTFAGARADYLTDFTSEFPDARTVRIDTSYRSNPPILAAANAFSRDIPHATALVPVNPETPARKLPSLTEYADDAAEAAGVAASMSADLAAGTPPADIAVLARTGAHLTRIAQACEQAGIPVRLAAGQPFFARPEVRAVVAALHAAVVAQQDAGPLFHTVSAVLRERGWTQRMPTPGPERQLWLAMDAVMRLADASPPGTTLAEFSADLRERAANQVEPSLAAVTFVTMHAAKGLEWPVVYVTGVREGLMPATGADLDEERRLLYVAITRAQARLRLTYGRAETQPSRLLAAFGNRIRRETSPEAPRDGSR